jgi:hypothetical protein
VVGSFREQPTSLSRRFEKSVVGYSVIFPRLSDRAYSVTGTELLRSHGNLLAATVLGDVALVSRTSSFQPRFRPVFFTTE